VTDSDFLVFVGVFALSGDPLQRIGNRLDSDEKPPQDVRRDDQRCWDHNTEEDLLYHQQ
jgi:hypothetical protein